MSVKPSANSSVSTRPGMPSGPAALHEQTLQVESVIGRSLGGSSALIRVCVFLSIKGVEIFRKGGSPDLWRSINRVVLSKCLDALPYVSMVRVFEVVLYLQFMFMIPFLRLGIN